LFATYNAVWLPQEVRVDCKKKTCGVAEKIKPKIHIVPVFARKNTLIDVDCTQKSSCWLQLSCRFWVATWLQKKLMVGYFLPT
jgi:hypothetical protein